MDLCCMIIGAAILLLPPFLLCWTAAVVAVRALRDRPIGFQRTFDAMATGCHLMLIWGFLSLIVAMVAGCAVAIPFLVFADSHVVPDIGLNVVPAAGALAIAIVSWSVVRPIICEEWDRLTKTDKPFGPDAYSPTSQDS